MAKQLARLPARIAELIDKHQKLALETDAVIDEAFAEARGMAPLFRQCTIDSKASKGYSHLIALRLLEQHLKGQKLWHG